MIYDELGQSEGRDLLDALDTAMGKRAEPLMIVISTQAARDEAPLSQLIDYGLRIHRGEIADPSFHLTLYTGPRKRIRGSGRLGSWPILHWTISVRSRTLSAWHCKRSECRALKRVSATSSSINASTQPRNSSPWPHGKRVASNRVIPTWKGRPCYAGLDLGATRDMTALVLVFAGEDGAFDVVAVLLAAWRDFAGT